MKELFIKYFRDASSYQSIDPTCFNLTEYTETWLINHKEQLTIPRVVNCLSCGKNHAELCGSCVSDIAQATGEQAQQSR